jgi:hypothetical protein
MPSRAQSQITRALHIAREPGRGRTARLWHTATDALSALGGRADMRISPIGSIRAGGGSYLHIRRAVSQSLSSLRLSSSMDRLFPRMEEAKPH